MIIQSIDIATAVRISEQIPEFSDAYDVVEYQKRLHSNKHLLLGAFEGNKAMGFKVGYEREGYFYSWMGGVLPQFRRLGVAQKLAEQQEIWAKNNGYTTIRFKTRNYLKGMLIFGLKNGFDIIEVIPYPNVDQNRIILQKKLTE